jgi:hypothetical protein
VKKERKKYHSLFKEPVAAEGGIYRTISFRKNLKVIYHFKNIPFDYTRAKPILKEFIKDL